MNPGGARAGRLHVVADLHVSVADHDISVTGDGAQLTVHTADAPALLALAADSEPVGGNPVPLRRIAANAGRLLNEAGLSVRFVGDRGMVIELGTGAASRLSRLLLGTEHARFGSPRALLPIAVEFARTPSTARKQVQSAVGGLALAVVLVVAGSRRRASRPAST